MSRRDSRENALKILYAREYRQSESVVDIFDDSIDKFEMENDNYTNLLVMGVDADSDELNEIITKCAKGRSINRISKISLILLRIALYEITKVEDIPYKVSINEAIEISKKYDNPQSARFVNGVLNRASTMLGLKEENTEK